MNKIRDEIMELMKENPPSIMIYDYSNGYFDALQDVLKILDKYDNLILEKSSEVEAMYLKDDTALEDKRTFVKNLGKVAMQTRDGCTGMELDDDGNHVVVSFHGGGTHTVNIHMDSYAAIMMDCSKALQ